MHHRLTAFTDPSGSTKLCYDRRGNVKRKLAVVNGVTQTTRWSYNLAGRIAQLIYPSGAQASYTRDALGRISAIAVTPAGGSLQTLISAVSYYPFGPVKKITWGNDETQTRSYDQNYWIDQIDSNLPGSHALDLDFTLDAVGNITALSDVLGGQPPNNSYVYDDLYRLSGAYADGAPVPKAAQEASAAFGFSESYTYDAIGNRTSKTVDVNPAVPYSYGSDSHRLLAVGASGRTYDANGNTTRRDLSSRSDATLVYDERNRLVSVTSPGGNASYRHNARGERVFKNAAGKLTRYAYDESGRLLVEDGSASGGAVQQMLWLDDLPVGLLIGTTLYKIQPDHLGSPRKITSGKVSASTLLWDWPILDNPFGEMSPGQESLQSEAIAFGTSLTFNLRFPGQQYDAETGLSYNYFRDYEPGVGRYVESDPVGLVGGLASYAYVSSDPTGSVDYDGLNQARVNARNRATRERSRRPKSGDGADSDPWRGTELFRCAKMRCCRESTECIVNRQGTTDDEICYESYFQPANPSVTWVQSRGHGGDDRYTCKCVTKYPAWWDERLQTDPGSASPEDYAEFLKTMRRNLRTRR